MKFSFRCSLWVPAYTSARSCSINDVFVYEWTREWRFLFSVVRVNPSASFVQRLPVFPLSNPARNRFLLSDHSRNLFSDSWSASTYEIRHGTSQAHLFGLEKIGK